MAMPQLLQKQVEKLLSTFCKSRVPSWLKEELRLDFAIEGEAATVYQEHRRCQGSCEWFRFPLAQFRYSTELNQWTLHHPGKVQRWELYLNIKPSLNLSRLIKEVDTDPLGLFWG